ncbi:MAG: cohesin domain-containing protein [Anaerolineaceae bacterium]|nr:cohesin domain-containing protein [Anaerolineaceae bacterium]
MKIRVLKTAMKFITFLCLVTVPWLMVNAQTSQTAKVGFFKSYNIPTDTKVEIPVEIKDVNALYAIDFQMTFDPSILQVEDADSDSPGTQIAQATFLEAGMVLFNDADNALGKIRFITSQLNPSEPKSGAGVLFVIYFTGIKEGTSALTITNLQLADRQGNEIPSMKAEDSISVAKDAPLINATTIPVLNPTQMIILQVTPQIAPTPTSTPIIEATEIPTEQIPPTNSVSEDSQPTQKSIEEPTVNGENSKFFLLDYWWIILILGVIVIGIAIYLLKTRNKVHKQEEKIL